MTEREQNGRNSLQIRPFSIETGVNRYAEGSVIIRAGNTHVLCTASIENTVPAWMSGKGKGWITAEYSMLPRSTHTRNKRDREKISGRTQEIQRLIGRGLRSMVNLNHLGERSIMIDCDVLQADGGTRTASITGGCVALAIALNRLIAAEKIPKETLTGLVSAISVGIKQNKVLVDLNYEEDSTCDVDMNFIMTGHGGLVEVQGTAEQEPFSPAQLSEMTAAALAASQEIHQLQLATLSQLKIN